MNVVATITRADVARMTAYTVVRYRLLWFLAALLSFLILWQQWNSDEWPTHWLQVIWVLGVDALVAGIFWSVIVAYFVIVTTFQTATRQGVLGEHTFEVRPDGFFEVTEFSETLTKWPAITRASKTSHAIIVRVSWWMFHIIPRRSFTSEQAYDEFFHQIQHHHTVQIES